MVKPIVAIDIDGTLGDYHGHLLTFASEYLGHGFPHGYPYKGDLRFRDWFCNAFDCDLRTFRDIKLAYRQGAQKRSMPVYPGAAGLTAMLRVEGEAEIWLTTTRPYLRLDGIDPDTRAWLDRAGIVYDALLYDEDKYRVLSERVDHGRVVAVLDDQADQLKAANTAFPRQLPAIKRGTAYNRAVAYTPQVSNLHHDARAIIAARIHNWRTKHAHT